MTAARGLILLFAASGLLTSCMKWDYDYDAEDIDSSGSGLFICNEGNFQYGNGTLSFYDPSNNRVENEVFFRANGYRLGDVVQSMTIAGNRGWVVVNNSNIVWAIDPDTFREVGRIGNLTSPRYFHQISDTKAYITQLWDNRIVVVDPSRYEITGYITVPDMTMASGSTEQMVQSGQYVYCSCWSYQNSILKIDTETDRVVDRLEVGIQPSSLVLDCNGKLWTLTVERRLKFTFEDTPSELQLNGEGDTLFWLNDDVWKMDVTSASLPDTPFIPCRKTKYYGLTVDPGNGDVYVADAIDYQQAGMIYRYSAEGELTDNFYVGIIPGAFCWKK